MEALYEQGFTAVEIAISLQPPRDRRRIERELEGGMVEQLYLNRSYKKYEPMYQTKQVYRSDRGQRAHEHKAANKGRGLKIGNDYELADYIERKIKEQRWSPGVIIGHIKAEGHVFKKSICTKTLYNYIEQGVFPTITHKDLWVKDEKFSYLDLNCIEAMPEKEIVIIIDGGGAKVGSIKWLKNTIQQRNIHRS